MICYELQLLNWEGSKETESNFVYQCKTDLNDNITYFFLSVIYLHTHLFILHIHLLFNHSIVRKKSGKLRNIAVNKL